MEIKRILFPAILLAALLVFASATAAEVIKSDVKIVDVEAGIEGPDLIIELTFVNKGDGAGTIDLQVEYLGTIDTSFEIIPGKNSRIFRYSITDIETGNVGLAILTDENMFFEIAVPNKLKDGSIDVRNLSEEQQPTPDPVLPDDTPKTTPEENNAQQDWESRLPSLQTIVDLANLAAGAIVALLLLRLAFRKKNKQEKDIAGTQQMLGVLKGMGKKETVKKSRTKKAKRK